MGMTMSQKILAAHAGLPEVKAGQLIEAKLDFFCIRQYKNRDDYGPLHSEQGYQGGNSG